MKTCTKCGESKHETEFYDGRARCKKCIRAESSAYSKAHRQDKTEANREWQSKNRDKVRASCLKWQAANRDSANAAMSRWKASNKDKIRIDKQNRRALIKFSGGRLSSGLANKLYGLQRGKCACCSGNLSGMYHLDHIMPLALGGSNTDDNIQLLCQTCNLQKHAKHPIDHMQSKGFLL